MTGVEFDDRVLRAGEVGVSLPPADYLRLFRSRRPEMLAKGRVIGHQGRLDAAWTLSMERLREEPEGVPAELLELAAFLAPAPIRST